MKQHFYFAAFAAAVLIASCQLPAGLNEDGFGAAKYNLPQVLSPANQKSLTLVPGTPGWFYLPVIQGQTYVLQGVSANGPAVLSVFHADKTTAYLTGVDPKLCPAFTATASENAFVQVTLNQGAANPVFTLGQTPYPILTPGGQFSNESYHSQCFWYAVPVVQGQKYMIYSTTPDSEYISLYAADQSTFIVSGLGSPYVFTASVTGTLFLAVQCQAYDPTAPFVVSLTRIIPTVLTPGTWTNGTLTAGQSLWYAVPVSAGVPVSIYWNDSCSGDGTKTCDVKVSAYRADGVTPLFTEVDSGYTQPQTVTDPVTETISLEVQGWSSNNSGTFAIKYQ